MTEDEGDITDTFRGWNESSKRWASNSPRAPYLPVVLFTVCAATSTAIAAFAHGERRTISALQAAAWAVGAIAAIPRLRRSASRLALTGAALVLILITLFVR